MRTIPLAALLTVIHPAAAAPRFSVTHLPYQINDPVSINIFGEIAGRYNAGKEPLSSATVYSRGKLLYPHDSGDDNASALCINAAGDAVGYHGYNSYSESLGFIYSHGKTTKIGTFGGESSSANGINDLGQIVGRASDANDKDRAFLLEKGVMTDLGTLGGSFAEATAINNSGQIVGYAAIAGETSHAFRYDHGTMLDLGVLPTAIDGESSATAINSKGQVVGWSYTGGGDHAFLYNRGRMIDLGTLGGNNSYAYGINSSGQIVGESTLRKNNDTLSHAFLYENGHMIDLGAFGGDSSKAAGINDAGQIVVNTVTGYDTIENGYLLTPIPTRPAVAILGAINPVTSASHIIIRGTASSGVKDISGRVGTGPFKHAAGTTHWHFLAKLEPGKNKITIRASGLGSASTTAQLTVTRK